MNKSILFGRLVKDPDIRYTQTQSGELAIANFRIAVNRKYAKENGPNADFFTCTAFGKKARVCFQLFCQRCQDCGRRTHGKMTTMKTTREKRCTVSA